MGIRTSRALLTESWTSDVTAIETAIGQFEAARAVTNDCEIALFEIDRDHHLHVNVTHKHPTRTVRGWAGPASLARGFVHNRRFDDRTPGRIISQIRHMVFAGRAIH
jgi:hypothetical protein